MNSNMIATSGRTVLKPSSGSTRRWISASSVHSTPSTAPSSSSTSSIRAALLLSRPPTLLREPSKLESTYFKYNQKLKFNLSQPFPKDFYFKKGSSAEGRFEKEQDIRRSELSGQINDSAITKQTKDYTNTQKSGQAQAESGGESSSANNPDEDLYKTLDRKTEADHKNDQQSLERKLDQNLWLFIKDATNGKGDWRLPSKAINLSGDKELLHKAAPSALTSILGSEMDLWVISNLPVGLVNKGQGVSEKSLAEQNGVEFLWLTKEEAFQKINEEKSDEAQQYWSRIEGLLE